MSHPRRRSSTKETDKSLATARSTLAQENGESDHGAPPSERFALQETLRALVPELGENEVYWLPIAVARLGMRTPNLRTVGLNVYPKVGENGGDGKIDPRKALMSTWHHAAKTEEELYDLQLKQRPAFAGGLSAQEEVDDGPEKRGFGSEEGDEEDEALQELLDDLKVAGYNRHFRRAKQRKSKRYSSALEEEIAKRNEHLRLRMEQMNARVKRFEKGFESLDALAVKMDTLAESSKLRVQFLEQCLVPLYNESARHQICRQNAEKAIETIDAALHHYKVPQELSAVIQAGPVKNLLAYCASLEKVKASVDFFSDFHTATPEFEQVSGLYRTGRENLIKEFRELLRMHSKPVPAVMIQDAIVNSLRDPSVSHELAHFAESAHNDLKLVTQWFIKTNDKYDFMEVYANFRSDTMRGSLDQFRTFYKDVLVTNEGNTGNEVDHDKKSLNVSVGRADAASGHSGDTISRFEDDTRSISMMVQDDAPVRSSTLKRQSTKSTPRKKAQAGTHGGAATLFQKLRKLKSSGAAKKSTGIRIGIDDETYQRVEIYMAMVSAFLKLIESEVSLMYGIIPVEHMREVFDRIIRPSMEKFEVMGKEMSTKILHHVQNGDFSAVLLLLQILEHFQDLQSLFDSALEGCTHQTQQNWANVQFIFRIAVLKTMDGFLASIKQSTDKVLPSDGTIHEVTSNTIAFLSNLVDFRPLFDVIIADDSSITARKSTPKQTPGLSSHNFPQYLNSVVTNLLSNLTTRAENYGDQTLKAIFLLNNTAYMSSYLKQAGIIEVMKEDKPAVEHLIQDRIADQKKAYMECWTLLSRLLTEAIGDAGLLRAQPTNDLSMKHTSTIDYSVQLKEKDRQALKDRCTVINKEIQQQAARQEKYSVPDTALRVALQKQNRDTILSLYTTYRERYIHIPFTKFHDKYLPFTSTQVADMLDRFFCQDTFSSALHVTGQSLRLDD